MLNERAIELGRIIGQTPEYQTVKRASGALNEDEAAVALLEQMERLRQDAQRLIQRGEQPSAEMEQQLDALLGQVQTNATYQRVMVANENFDKVMVQVNEWILEGIKKGGASSIITLA